MRYVALASDYSLDDTVSLLFFFLEPLLKTKATVVESALDKLSKLKNNCPQRKVGCLLLKSVLEYRQNKLTQLMEEHKKQEKNEKTKKSRKRK